MVICGEKKEVEMFVMDVQSYFFLWNKPISKKKRFWNILKYGLEKFRIKSLFDFFHSNILMLVVLISLFEGVWFIRKWAWPLSSLHLNTFSVQRSWKKIMHTVSSQDFCSLTFLSFFLLIFSTAFFFLWNHNIHFWQIFI